YSRTPPPSSTGARWMTISSSSPTWRHCRLRLAPKIPTSVAEGPVHRVVGAGDEAVQGHRVVTDRAHALPLDLRAREDSSPSASHPLAFEGAQRCNMPDMGVTRDAASPA